MRLTVVSLVATVLVHAAMAERNGPSNVLAPWRRYNETGGRIVNMRHESLSNSKRRPNVFKLTAVLRTPRNPQRKYPGTTTAKGPFVARGQRSDVRASGKSSPPKSYQKRRSLDLGMGLNRLSVSKLEEDAVYLEPVLRKESKTNLFGDLFGEDLPSDSGDELGPAIGPLEFPGIGKNVYIRLMVSPDKETTSHVTLHLVNKAPWPVDSFGEVHGSVDFAPPHKSEPLFIGEKPMAVAPTIPPKPLISMSPMNSRRSRFVDKSVHRFGFTPSKLEAMGLLGVQSHLKIPQAMASHRPAQFGNPRQYLPAPNHHRLPIALRPADNLIDLPIYPPLSVDGLRDEMTPNQNRANVSSDSQMDMDNVDDTQQSASSRHTSISRNDLSYQTAWRPIGVSVLREPEVRSKSGEFSDPVFMKEITAPDLSSGNFSMKSPPRKANVDEYDLGNPQLANTDTSPDEHVVTATLDYSPRHTTTFKPDHIFPRDTRSGEHKTDNPEGGLRSTTSHPLPTESGGRSLLRKKTN